LGPLRLIRNQSNPVHNAMRRDFGISAGIAGIVHTLLGLQVHLGGDILKYFAVPRGLSKGAFIFPGANWLGLLSAIVLLALVAISNNISIRSIGLTTWKRLQRLAYVAGAAAAAHAFLYFALEKRALSAVVLVAAITAAVIVIQARGLTIARRQRSTEAQTRLPQS
jgi:sulfoxide reductase heme-binding subunit YedZ